jgi:MFS family permease
MFPQLGPPVGFLIAVGSFLLLSQLLDDAQFRAWGWRIPFLSSAVLVVIGLYVRLKLAETPVFVQALKSHAPVKLPLSVLFAHHAKPMILGALVIVVCYALFYITTVFSLSYGVGKLGIPRPRFLWMLCVAVVFLAIATPLSALAGDRYGRRPVIIVAGCAAFLSGFLMEPMLGSGSLWLITAFLCLELFLMGCTFAPMGALLPELFPTAVRYTGAGAAYNLGGILGASLAPYLAQQLVLHGGLAWVGGYISIAAAISVLAALALSETRNRDLA